MICKMVNGSKKQKNSLKKTNDDKTKQLFVYMITIIKKRWIK